MGDNASHGLRRTNEDKRREVKMALEAMAEAGLNWSDREIARRCRVSDKTVAVVRDSLSAEIRRCDTPRTVERNGQTYEMKVPSRPGKPLEQLERASGPDSFLLQLAHSPAMMNAESNQHGLAACSILRARWRAG